VTTQTDCTSAVVTAAETDPGVVKLEVPGGQTMSIHEFATRCHRFSEIHLGALVVQDLAKRVLDLDKIFLILHHLIDVFVGARDFIKKRRGPI
jgi:hypothetical protein